LAPVVNGHEPPSRRDPGRPLDRVEPVVPVDPVAERRARIARYVKVAQRFGYACLVLAMVVFVVGLASDFPTWSVDLTVAALVAAIVVLPVPIVLGYGVRAAEREERGGGRFH
jgi:hypothetical protein